MAAEMQPQLGQRLEAIRQKAKNGKRMSRDEFAKLIGGSTTPTQVRNIEQGRKLKGDEYDRIVQRFPELAEPDPNWTDATVVDDASTTLNGAASPPGDYALVLSFEPTYAGAEDPPALDACFDEEDELDLDDLDELEPAAPVAETRALIALTPVAGPSTVDRTDGLLPVSNSEMQTFKRCRRKWWLAWYRGLRLAVEDATGARATGNRIHRALRAMYVPPELTPQDPRDALERAIVADWTKLTQAFAARGVEVPHELVARFNADTSLERAMVSNYLTWLAQSGKDGGLQVIAAETYLEAPFDLAEDPNGIYPPVKLIGKLDVRLYREYDGVRLFMDHKSVGSLTAPLRTIHLNEQMLHYHLLEWLAGVEGGRCDGALYNMLRKVKGTSTAKPPFFDRAEVRHNPHEIESFKLRLIGSIREMLDLRRALNEGANPSVVAYPTPTSDCSWDCDFLPVCSMFDDGSRVEDMLAQLYTSDDPLRHYEEKDKED